MKPFRKPGSRILALVVFSTALVSIALAMWGKFNIETCPDPLVLADGNSVGFMCTESRPAWLTAIIFISLFSLASMAVWKAYFRFQQRRGRDKDYQETFD